MQFLGLRNGHMLKQYIPMRELGSVIKLQHHIVDWLGSEESALMSPSGEALRQNGSIQVKLVFLWIHCQNRKGAFLCQKIQLFTLGGLEILKDASHSCHTWSEEVDHVGEDAIVRSAQS